MFVRFTVLTHVGKYLKIPDDIYRFGIGGNQQQKPILRFLKGHAFQIYFVIHINMFFCWINVFTHIGQYLKFPDEIYKFGFGRNRRKSDFAI